LRQARCFAAAIFASTNAITLFRISSVANARSHEQEREHAEGISKQTVTFDNLADDAVRGLTRGKGTARKGDTDRCETGQGKDHGVRSARLALLDDRKIAPVVAGAKLHIQSNRSGGRVGQGQWGLPPD
jgi:hypothetical protein